MLPRLSTLPGTSLTSQLRATSPSEPHQADGVLSHSTDEQVRMAIRPSHTALLGVLAAAPAAALDPRRYPASTSSAPGRDPTP